MAASSLPDRLRSLEREVSLIEPLAAERLGSLANTIAQPKAVSGWAGVDVMRAIRATEIARLVRERPLADARLAWMERLRNVLALLPILLTWVGLMYAAVGYRALAQADPNLLSRPFLLLWEDGFNGLVSFPWSLLNWFTLSHVALLDVLALSTVVIFSWLIHTQTNVQQVKREAAARALERQLHDASLEAALVLAERASPAVQIDQFRDAMQGLLDELEAQRQAADELVREREREVSDLQSFARDLRNSVGDLRREVDDVKLGFNLLRRLTEAVETRLAASGDQSEALRSTVQALTPVLERHAASQTQAAERLETAASTLSTTAARAERASSQTAETVKTLIGTLQTFTTEMQQQRASQESLAASLTRSGEQMATSVTGLQTASDRVQTLALGFQSVVDQLGTIQADLRTTLAGLGTAGTQTASNVERLVESLLRVRHSMSGTEARLAGLAEDLRALIAAFNRIAADVDLTLLPPAPRRRWWQWILRRRRGTTDTALSPTDGSVPGRRSANRRS